MPLTQVLALPPIILEGTIVEIDVDSWAVLDPINGEIYETVNGDRSVEYDVWPTLDEAVESLNMWNGESELAHMATWR